MRMKEKIFLSVFWVIVALMPHSVFAQIENPPKDPNEGPDYTPTVNISVSFDKATNLVSIQLDRTIEEAELLIFKDGYLIERADVSNIPRSMPFSFFLTEIGHYIIYIRIDSDEFDVFEKYIE